MGADSSPAAPLLIQLHANASGETVEDGPCAWSPATHMKDLEDAPGLWFQAGPVLAIPVI